MTKLKLKSLLEEKPVKITVEMPGDVYRDLVTYAEVLTRDSDQPIADPAKLLVPMVQQFMATDREFARARRSKAKDITSEPR